MEFPSGNDQALSKSKGWINKALDEIGTTKINDENMKILKGKAIDSRVHATWWK